MAATVAAKPRIPRPPTATSPLETQGQVPYRTSGKQRRVGGEKAQPGRPTQGCRAVVARAGRAVASSLGDDHVGWRRTNLNGSVPTLSSRQPSPTPARPPTAHTNASIVSATSERSPSARPRCLNVNSTAGGVPPPHDSDRTNLIRRSSTKRSYTKTPSVLPCPTMRPPDSDRPDSDRPSLRKLSLLCQEEPAVPA